MSDRANPGATPGPDLSGARDDAESMVDWDLALATARRLLRPGPDVTVDEARQVVADLREFATKAEGHVRSYTGLHTTGARAPVVVVDRNGWVQANVDAFRQVLEPLVDKVRERRGGADLSRMGTFGSRVTGVEAGALLAFLSSKVLGQFDPFWSDGAVGVPAPRVSPDGGVDGAGAAGTPEGRAAELVPSAPPAGRLLLVAPNVAHVERELGVDPHDFRLWVCLHEETHRVQFTAVPWLRDHLRGQIRSFLEETDIDPTAMFSHLRQGFEQLGRTARGGQQEVSFIDLVQTPAQREILDQVTAVMSLLEGHADVVMDGVGPEVIPSVATIRSSFQQRRSGGSWLDQFLKRMLGLDAKLRQYRDGAAFVRTTVAAVGQEGFNAVWASPAHLPTKAEIHDPDAWVRRVHG
ncbi:zinc-dependent metalloprotease [Actinopolymorpha alba]|uniref:zinc-dependent metalloprotease n=1 Tax=Actinopolymorpha alba TaxID=533267 RepID=UPI00036141C9|nr:zinc-dependent metalloprotease [Actinopolymorpha alba]